MSVAVKPSYDSEWEKGRNPSFFIRPKIPSVGLFTPLVFPLIGHKRPFIRNDDLFRSSGFTLTELVIALAIAALLLTLAAPNMRSFILNNRITTETNTLMAHINLARSEATKRGCVVVLCRKDPTKVATCGGGVANDWTSGWLVYAPTLPVGGWTVANQAKCSTEANFDPADHTLLKDEPTITNGVTVTSNNAGNLWLAYQANGQLTTAGTLRFSMCDDRNEAFGKNIEILGSGRPVLTKTTAADPTKDCTPS
jgi:type IV fimbrial biogenesis protein FimT